MYIHKEGKNYVAIGIILFSVLNLLNYYLFVSYWWLYYPILILTFLLLVWVFWFFRIPDREATTGEELVMSPCDGKVVVIEEVEEPEYFKDKRIQLSIFMSPLNVHVNLYPISGKVDYVKYHKGKYLVAWHPKSSTDNERCTVVVSNAKTSLLIRQIAGAVARRIVTYSKEGQSVSQNDELGFIKFGSRVDVYLPLGTQIDVKIGDVVTNKESILAKFSS
jgi:phosphatidylserine decarboxylase